jgi:hypothetical protein
MLNGPVNGPKIIPYIGANASDMEKNTPAIPTMGNVGNNLRIKYNTEKTDANAIFLLVIYFEGRIFTFIA